MRTPSILQAGIACLYVVAPALLAEQIVFSEIHYNPKDGKPEYIEICNLTATPFDIANWKLSDGVVYEFPEFNARHAEDTYLEPFESYAVGRNMLSVQGWEGDVVFGGARISNDAGDLARLAASR